MAVRRPFTMLYNDIIDEKFVDLSRTALLVWINLIRRAHPQDHCWPSIQNIAEAVKCPRRSVERALPELEKAGLLRREYRRGQQTNMYHLLDQHPVSNDGGHPAEMAGTPGAIGGSPPAEMAGHTVVRSEQDLLNKNQEQEGATPRTAFFSSSSERENSNKNNADYPPLTDLDQARQGMLERYGIKGRKLEELSRARLRPYPDMREIILAWDEYTGTGALIRQIEAADESLRGYLAERTLRIAN